MRDKKPMRNKDIIDRQIENMARPCVFCGGPCNQSYGNPNNPLRNCTRCAPLGGNLVFKNGQPMVTATGLRKAFDLGIRLVIPVIQKPVHVKQPRKEERHVPAGKIFSSSKDANIVFGKVGNQFMGHSGKKVTTDVEEYAKRAKVKIS